MSDISWVTDHSACDFADKPVRCDRCHREYVCTPSSDYYCTPEGDHCCEPCLVRFTALQVIIGLSGPHAVEVQP